MTQFYWALRRTWSMARKEFVHIWMDPGALFLVVLAPAVVLTLLAYVFTFDASESDLAVVDLDQTPASDAYVRALTSDGHIDVVAYPESYEEAETLIKKGRVNGALIIPPGFGAALDEGHYAPAQNLVDGVDASAALQVIGAMDIRTRLFSAQMASQAAALPVEVRTRIWFNENMSSQHSMIPGLMSLVLILPAMAVALGLTREKETGTLETLVTTPVMGSDVLVGKLLVYLVMGVLSALVSLLVAIVWFHVPFRGNLFLWLLATAAYLLACMGFSVMVANFAKSQQTAMVIILMALFMPGFLMSGLSDPIDTTATASMIGSYLLPTTHYISLSRAIWLKGLPIRMLWTQLAILFGMGVIGATAAVALFRKKIA